MSSRTRCSSGLSTRRRVETMCCASTARHRRAAAFAALDATACGVQVLDDTDQTLGGRDELPRRGAQPGVLAVEPGPGLPGIRAHDRVEGAEQPHEEGSQLPGFLLGRQENVT